MQLRNRRFFGSGLKQFVEGRCNTPPKDLIIVCKDLVEIGLSQRLFISIQQKCSSIDSIWCLNDQFRKPRAMLRGFLITWQQLPRHKAALEYTKSVL